MIARSSFKEASFAEAFHVRPIFFPFLCLGQFFNISIKGVAMEQGFQFRSRQSSVEGSFKLQHPYLPYQPHEEPLRRPV